MRKQEVKLSRLFDKRVKPTILESCKEMRNDMRNKQEFTENFGNTSVGKGDKKFDKVGELGKIHNKQLNITREHHDLDSTT